MKIIVNLKDPDGFWDGIRTSVRNELERTMPQLDPDDIEILADKKESDAREALRTWVEYGEYINIEFDTEAKTATVKPL